MTRQATISFGVDTPIKASENNTTSITVEELHSVAAWPTTDLLIKKPSSGNSPRQVSSGQSYTFSKNGRSFATGEIVGYVAPAANVTTTIAIDEQAAP